MIISDNTAYTAVKTAPDNVVVINMDDVELSNSVEEIRYITSQMESYVLLRVKNNFNEVKQYIETKAKKFSILVKDLKPEAQSTANLLLVVYGFLMNFFEIAFMDNDSFNKILPSIDNTENHFISTSQSILNDFSRVLSGLIRSERFIVVKKYKNMQIDSNHDVILDGDRLKIICNLTKNRLCISGTIFVRYCLKSSLYHFAKKRLTL